MFKSSKRYSYGMLVPAGKYFKGDNLNLKMRYEFYTNSEKIEKFTVEANTPIEENLGLMRTMNELGRRGWRLVNVDNGIYYFEKEEEL